MTPLVLTLALMSSWVPSSAISHGSPCSCILAESDGHRWVYTHSGKWTYDSKKYWVSEAQCVHIYTAALDKKQEPWVPDMTEQENQTCGPDAHEHTYFLDKNGQFEVEREKGEPDIVFDGQCHDNNDEHRIVPPSERKILPVPKLKEN